MQSFNRSLSSGRIKIITTAEQEKALREALHSEIQKKSKACSNRTYNCSIPRIDGYDFCIRHILQDSRAPYKQCAFVYSNNKKCTQAAPKHDTKKDLALTPYCFEHSRLMQLIKTRTTIGKYKQIDSNETLLSDLSHHLSIDKDEPNSSIFETDEEIVDVVTSNAEPFVNYSCTNNFNTISKKVKSKKRILDYASDSSSDGEVPNLSNTSKAYEWDTSDDESLDSAEDDVLKHAVTYTTEEATMITKRKMQKLQKLYIEQISRLNYILKEKRRKYLQALRKEKETLCSIHDQEKENPQDHKMYEKLKALNHYHRRYGEEAILYKKFKEKRIKSAEDYIPKVHHGPIKCIYTEGGVKCGEKVVPACKYCRKHILEDKRQCLFRACGIERSGVICQEPVPNIFDDSTCILHISLPSTQKIYTQKKFESETEDDEEENTTDCIKGESDIKKEDLQETVSCGYVQANLESNITQFKQNNSVVLKKEKFDTDDRNDEENFVTIKQEISLTIEDENLNEENTVRKTMANHNIKQEIFIQEQNKIINQSETDIADTSLITNIIVDESEEADDIIVEQLHSHNEKME